MARITIQVLEGFERGRIFGDLATPITIGREEDNTIQLNDERVSRFHVKIQEDSGRVILTDLDSTNGTRINGHPVQMRVLQFGDQMSIGRSLLLYGSPGEIDGQSRAAESDDKTGLEVGEPQGAHRTVSGAARRWFKHHRSAGGIARFGRRSGRTVPEQRPGAAHRSRQWPRWRNSRTCWPMFTISWPSSSTLGDGGSPRKYRPHARRPRPLATTAQGRDAIGQLYATNRQTRNAEG